MLHNSSSSVLFAKPSLNMVYYCVEQRRKANIQLMHVQYTGWILYLHVYIRVKMVLQPGEWKGKNINKELVIGRNMITASQRSKVDIWQQCKIGGKKVEQCKGMASDGEVCIS